MIFRHYVYAGMAGFMAIAMSGCSGVTAEQRRSGPDIYHNQCQALAPKGQPDMDDPFKGRQPDEIRRRIVPDARQRMGDLDFQSIMTCLSGSLGAGDKD